MTTAADTIANDLLMLGVSLNRVSIVGGTAALDGQPLRECTVEQILDRIEAEKHPAIRRMMAQMLYDRGHDDGVTKGNRDAMRAIRPARWNGGAK